MGADVLVTQGASNHDIYCAEPEQFSPYLLRVN